MRFAKQNLVQLAVHADHILVTGIQSQVRHEVAEKFARIALRLEKKNGARRISQPFQQMEEQRGLAHTWLGNERQESSTGIDAVTQGRQGFTMARAKIEEARVGRHTKRLFR